MRLNLIMWEKQNHLKAKEVAQKLGINDATYCNIKSGKQTPSIEFAYKFEDAFPGVNVLELMKKFE